MGIPIAFSLCELDQWEGAGYRLAHSSRFAYPRAVTVKIMRVIRAPNVTAE